MEGALEMHRHAIETLTFLTAPGFPSALCQGHGYRVSACALPAAECEHFFTIRGYFFLIASRWHLSRDFRGGASRG